VSMNLMCDKRPSPSCLYSSDPPPLLWVPSMMSHASLSSSCDMTGSRGSREESSCCCTSFASMYPSAPACLCSILQALQITRRSQTSRGSFGDRWSEARGVLMARGLVKKPDVGELPQGPPVAEKACPGGVPHMLAVFALPKPPCENGWCELGASGKPKPMGILLIEP
jgi:hypothetical protein